MRGFGVQFPGMAPNFSRNVPGSFPPARSCDDSLRALLLPRSTTAARLLTRAAPISKQNHGLSGDIEPFAATKIFAYGYIVFADHIRPGARKPFPVLLVGPRRQRCLLSPDDPAKIVTFRLPARGTTQRGRMSFFSFRKKISFFHRHSLSLNIKNPECRRLRINPGANQRQLRLPNLCRHRELAQRILDWPRFPNNRNFPGLQTPHPTPPPNRITSVGLFQSYPRRS